MKTTSVESQMKENTHKKKFFFFLKKRTYKYPMQTRMTENENE